MLNFNKKTTWLKRKNIISNSTRMIPMPRLCLHSILMLNLSPLNKKIMKNMIKSWSVLTKSGCLDLNTWQSLQNSSMHVAVRLCEFIFGIYSTMQTLTLPRSKTCSRLSKTACKRNMISKNSMRMSKRLIIWIHLKTMTARCLQVKIVQTNNWSMTLESWPNIMCLLKLSILNQSSLNQI